MVQQCRGNLYSSFLLYNASADHDGQMMLDRTKCQESFPAISMVHDAELDRIRLSGKHILNSGIKKEMMKTSRD